MSEPLHVQVLNALMTRLTTPALDAPPTPIASPLVAYSPTAGVPYFEAHRIMRADPEQPWIAAESDAVHRGIFQVDAVVPNDQGEAPGIRLASLVVDRFSFGTLIDLDACRLKIVRTPGIAAAISDSPWARFPVSIPYLVIA